MSCCKNKYYARPCVYYNNNEERVAEDNCPNFNQNNPPCKPCNCAPSFEKSLCKFINEKVIICSGGCRICVILTDVCCNFIRTIDFMSGKVIYFNINRIDSIDYVLPSCCN